MRRTPRPLLSVILLFLVFSSLLAQAQKNLFKSTLSLDSIREKTEIKYFLKNPSTWIQNSINILNSLTLPSQILLDTTFIQSKLERISASGEMIKENLKDDFGSIRLRYILEYSNELQTGFNEMLDLQSSIQKQNNNLTNQTLVAADIQNEVEYFNDNASPSIKAIYQNEIVLLNSTIERTNSYISERLNKHVKLENSVNTVTFQLQENIKYAHSLIQEKRKSLFRSNYPPIWKTKASDYQQSMLQSIIQTFDRSKESVLFFLDHGNIMAVIFRIVILLLIMLPLLIYYRRGNIDFSNPKPGRYLNRFPNEVTLLVLLIMAPFMFDHLPFILMDLFSISQTLVIAIIFIRAQDTVHRRSLYFIIAFYFLMKFLNLLVTPTFAGRIIVTFSILIYFPIIRLYRDYVASNGQTKMAKFLFIYLLAQMTLGWLMTMFGYFLLGRTYFIGAINAFVLIFVLYISVYTILDYLRLIIKIINKRLKSFYLNGDVVEKYIGNLIKGFASLLFLIAYTSNLNIYDFVASAISDWFNEPRQLGQSIFSYYSILLFVLYFMGAVLTADFFNKLIDTNDNKKNIKRRTSLGSFMLLFRFALISVGFILAVLASGMPLTQITVLMGALGVGIGFGLQNIFNNMISGLIIAIEKPISVGDMIEVGSNIGWVKGIGIRSSNIQAFDGAEVIIPNGELISNKVTNWTLSDKTRRMDIQVGVAYKSDPHQVYDVLIKVVAAHPEVLKNPEPFIIFTGLGESSLDFKIYFWISDFVEGMRIRSEVLFQVFDALHQNNIEIPFPQRDLHLKSVEPELMKQNSVALKNKQE
jgi:small-conductance mechanosensitive channel